MQQRAQEKRRGKKRERDAYAPTALSPSLSLRAYKMLSRLRR